ncbi:pentapeptide repeat-containing protein, partial [Actinomadura parmotrematis]
MPSEGSVTILHLSDLQFGEKHRHGREGVTAGDRRLSSLAARLLDDLKDVRRAEGIAPDLVVVSGDLAERARPAEYEQVGEFLTDLTAGLGLDAGRTVMVPGNHDVNWLKCQAYFIDCEGDESSPVPPYWPKYRFYAEMFAAFYEGGEARFPKDMPWTLFRIPELKVVVAGLNSTIAESHQSEDHYGFCGEEQLRWFGTALADYERDGWLRIGVLHHNPVIRDGKDHKFLRDHQMFQEVLGPRLNLVLSGHIHEARLNSLGPDGLVTLGTGSAGVRADARPDEAPNQYQLVRVTADGFDIHARRYNPDRFRWEGDTSIGRERSESVRVLRRPLDSVHAAFPDPVSMQRVRFRFEKGPLRDRSAREPDDLLARVRAVCKVRYPEADVERIDFGPGRPQGHLRITGLKPPQTFQYPVGVIEGAATREAVDAFLTEVDARYRAGDPTVQSYLVYDGPRTSQELRAFAASKGVNLQQLMEFQGMYDLQPYADRQAERLAADETIYAPRLFVPQRFSLVSGRGGPAGEVQTDLLSRLREWVADPEGRFVVVLGDFGHGKTFLLRELTRTIHETGEPPVIPIFIQLRELEKAHGLEELLAAQLTAGGEEVINHRKLGHLIRDGRVLLLFDGFDELALRVTYKQAAEHLANLVKIQGESKAKVVVTSRTQHFLSDRQVETSLARITDLPARRLVKLHDFGEEQILDFLIRLMNGDEAAARDRLELIRHIKDLLGLSRNPRMLSFIVRLDFARLQQIKETEGAISAARLYKELLDQWLIYEYERAQPAGAAPTLSAEDRWAAVTALARLLWESNEETLGLNELTQVSAALQNLVECQLSEDEAAHVLGSGTLLVRTEDERFRFVHRSVMEWLVADHIAASLARSDEWPAALMKRKMSDLMIEFLCGRAESRSIVEWARQVLASGTDDVRVSDAAAWNALLLLRWLGRAPSLVCEGPIQLNGNDLRGIDLTGMNLRGAELRQAKLHGAKLEGTDLSSADLRQAKIPGASITDVDFSGADLREADLKRCSGSRARFSDSDLSGADLATVRLPMADFVGAKTTGMKLGRASLLGAALEVGSPDFNDIAGAVLPRHALPRLALAPSYSGINSAVAWSPDGHALATADYWT